MNLSRFEPSLRHFAKLIANFILAFRASILLLVVSITTTFIIIGHKSDIINFPFNAGVWGGVSDWTMVVVTIITAILLLWTLNEQRKINKSQIQINNQNSARHLREIRPYFRVTREVDTLLLAVTNAVAMDVLIFKTDSFGHEKNENEADFIFEVWTLDFHSVYVPHKEYIAQLTVDRQFVMAKIYFKDEEGNEYFQELLGNKYSAFTTFPKLTKLNYNN